MNYKKYLTEFLGTAILVFAGSAAAISINTMLSAMGMQIPMGISTISVALCFGLCYMAMYYCFARVSGAHLNPAVSFGMLISGYMNIKETVLYMVSQFVGGIAGAALCGLALGFRDTLFSSGFAGMSTFGTSLKSAIVIDVVMTFVFVYLFISVSKDEKMKKPAGLIIGLAFALVYMVEIPFTNGSSNPARSLGTALLQTQGNALSQVWIFIAAPLLGAALAGLFYIFLNETKYDEKAKAAVEVAEAAEAIDEVEAAIDEAEAILEEEVREEIATEAEEDK